MHGIQLRLSWAMTAFMEWQMECGEILDQQAGLKGSKTPAPEDKVKELEDELRSLECNGKGLRGASNREAVNNKIYAKAFADILSGELDESIRRRCKPVYCKRRSWSAISSWAADALSVGSYSRCR